VCSANEIYVEGPAPVWAQKKTHLNNNDLVAFVKSSVGTFFFFSSYEKRVKNMEGKQKKKKEIERMPQAGQS